MPRPKLSAAKKKGTLSVSLTPEVLAILARADNKSRALDTAVRSCAQFLRLVEELEAGKIRPADFIDEVSDYAAVWNAEIDETISLDELKAGISTRGAIEKAVGTAAAAKAGRPVARKKPAA